MGVADNKSYKDQSPYFKELYPFNAHHDYPSLDVDQKIGSTIKDNPYHANVEIEGDEVVLNPDMSALFKAVGKKHSQGGMDVVLKPNSFIYSDDKTLALDEDDHHLLELKEGGNFKPDKNTPAEVIRRNVHLKHYNTLVSNLKDPKRDYLTKVSSARMLEKYINTLGRVAYSQEAKKGFPTGLPHFSVGTAPVYSPQVKEELMENKQYGKYGGTTSNPYMQPGGQWKPPFLIDGSPTNLTVGPDPEWIPPFLFQKPPQTNNYPAWYNGRLKPNSFGSPYNPIANSTIPAPTPKTSGNSANGNDGAYSGVPVSGVPPKESGVPPTDVVLHPNPHDLPDIAPPETTPPSTTAQTTIQPGTVPGGQKPIQANWQFTPWQRLSHLYNWAQYANAKRYMPYRSHYNATYTDPVMLNPEQAISDARALANQQLGAVNTLNPFLRNAQAASIYGQELNQIPQLRSQYDNYNAQIANEARIYNNQVKNQETQSNLGFDQQYYQQAVEGRKNFDNLRTFLGNQAMNNVFRDVETNQGLAYHFLTENNPAYGYDWKTGNFYRNPKDIRDVESSAQGDYIGNVLNNIDLKTLNNTERINLLRELQRGRALQYLNPSFGQQPYFKKGGKNPYKY